MELTNMQVAQASYAMGILSNQIDSLDYSTKELMMSLIDVGIIQTHPKLTGYLTRFRDVLGDLQDVVTAIMGYVSDGREPDIDIQVLADSDPEDGADASGIRSARLKAMSVSEGTNGPIMHLDLGEDCLSIDVSVAMARDLSEQLSAVADCYGGACR